MCGAARGFVLKKQHIAHGEITAGQLFSDSMAGPEGSGFITARRAPPEETAFCLAPFVYG